MSKKDKVVIAGIALFVICAITLIMGANSVFAQGKGQKTPLTTYWMSVSTEKSGFPGMPAGGMPGMGAMFGGRGGDSGKRLQLQVSSPRSTPADPNATHDIPPGQNMGPTLPLVTPEIERAERGEAGRPDRPEKMEKPRMRMLIYWGCSETVKPGQPFVIDTERMDPSEFGRVFQGRRLSMQYPPSPHSGRTYADWPNRKDSKKVPADSSLVGSQFVHGNYLPDIRFSIGPDHDFMAPVEFTSTKGSPDESFYFQWNSIPTATGYFATAMGHDQKTGTMIIWSSSEVREAGYSLMNFLSDRDVRMLVRDGVVMPPSVTQCVVPRGIFKDAEGAMIQFIAYGDELNIVYPPRDPVKPRDPIWTVKVRRKSTSMLPLMAMEGMPSGRRDRYDRGERRDRDDAPPPPEERPEKITPGKVLKGIFGL